MTRKRKAPSEQETPSPSKRKGKAPVLYVDDTDDFDATDADSGEENDDDDDNISEDDVDGAVGILDPDFPEDVPPSPHTPIQLPKKRKSFGTPNHGVQKGSSRRTALTGKVHKVSIHGSLCSLKLQSSACNANEVSHALHRADGYSDINKMDSFAYHWGKGPDGINLDSRSNASIVDTTLHRVGDHGENEKLAEEDKIPLEDMLPMPAEGWPSQLLPLDIDPSHVITRSRVVRVRAGENEWKPVGRPSQHCHPYRKFGLIRTHVNPFFRIADAYTKNLKLRSFWTKKQLKAVELVTHIMAVWLVPAPHDFLERARVKRAERAEKLKERRARRRTKKNDQPEAGPSNHRASEEPSPSPLSNL